MQNTALLIGPAGVCEEHQRQEIASLLGCSKIIDNWDGKTAPPPGALVITDLRPPFDQLDALLVDKTAIHICPNQKALQQTVEDLRYKKKLDEAVQWRA